MAQLLYTHNRRLADRYLHDPLFHQLVDRMVLLLEGPDVTWFHLNAAVALAADIVEEKRIDAFMRGK